MSNIDLNKLKTELESFGLLINDKQLQQFDMYYELLVSWNQKMNLTAITEPEDVRVKHFVDSAALLSFEKIKGSVIDVGTGAGFPGIPLKILCPDITLTLLDSLDKRIKFLNEVCDKLELKDVSLVHGRAEDFGRDSNYREKFDYCVSRAVSNLSVLSEYDLPFVKCEGKFISYKSYDSIDEIKSSNNAIDILGGKIEQNLTVTLPFTDLKRRFVIIDKVSPTPEKYPRRAGKPEKKPL